MEKLRLSERLRTVAQWIHPQNVVADIGTDHGYLPIYIIKSNISSRVIAMDVRREPLRKAQENAFAYGVDKQIELRLSDGLDKLESLEADTVTICGMGGRLMQHILKQGADKIDGKTQLIVSPQSEIKEFRQFLADNGFETIREEMLKEDGQYYFIMECRHTGKWLADRQAEAMPKMMQQTAGANLQQEVFFRYGRMLLTQKNMCLLEYLQREKALVEKVQERVNRACSESAAVKARKDQLAYDIECIDYALKYYNRE